MRQETKDEVTHTLDCDLMEKTTERVVLYSDKLFWRTAIEWLVATDQVCHQHIACNYLLNVLMFCSPSKLLNIPSSRAWLMSHLVQKMVSTFQVGRWRKGRSNGCSWNISHGWKPYSVYVIPMLWGCLPLKPLTPFFSHCRVLPSKAKWA